MEMHVHLHVLQKTNQNKKVYRFRRVLKKYIRDQNYIQRQLRRISFLTSRKKLISKTKPADQTERIQAHQKDASEKLRGNTQTNTHTHPHTPKPNTKTTSQWVMTRDFWVSLGDWRSFKTTALLALPCYASTSAFTSSVCSYRHQCFYSHGYLTCHLSSFHFY